MPGAMDLGVADNNECVGHEQAAQIAVTLFADAAKPFLAPTASAQNNDQASGSFKRNSASAPAGFCQEPSLMRLNNRASDEQARPMPFSLSKEGVGS